MYRHTGQRKLGKEDIELACDEKACSGQWLKNWKKEREKEKAMRNWEVESGASDLLRLQ